MSNANEEYPRCTGSAFPPVLDACCSKRAFWFDRKDSRALFVDKRRETITRSDVSSTGGSRDIVIDPDTLADFTDLPFPVDTFDHVVFDPPHMVNVGDTSYLARQYGKLIGDWRDMLRKGFAECFRVLRPDGVLVFKWSDSNVPVSEILPLTPHKPLFGHKSGKAMNTHWIAFLKPTTA